MSDKTVFWKSDWFTSLVVALLVLLFSSSAPLQGIERFAYDWGVQSSSRAPSDKVAIIAIDQPSINNLGRWPWPRDYHAQMIDSLKEAGAKVVAYTAFFSEPQIDQGYVMIDDMYSYYQEKNLGKDTDLKVLGKKMESALKTLNVDKILADSMQEAGNVLVPMFFHLGSPTGNPDEPLQDYIVKYAINDVVDEIGAFETGKIPLETFFAEPVIDTIGRQTAGIGHLNANPDVDGGIRSEPLVLNHYDVYYPSLSLLIAAKSLNLGVDDIKVRLGQGVQLGKLNIGTDENLQMQTFFYSSDEDNAFQVDSFYDVVVGNIPAEKYKGKIVLIGATAAGVGSTQVTPISPDMSPIVTLAHSVSSILNEDFFTIPSWSLWAWLGAFLAITLYLMFILPQMKARAAAIVTAVLLLILIGMHYSLMTSQAIWVQFMIPAVLLITGYLVLTTKRFLVSERGKTLSDVESAESNRMLGLAYQGQGQLDMAFEKFRKCPKDNAIAEVLYNLAADFERKRQFGKSSNVYQYIHEFNPGFRDIAKRVDRSKKMEETVILGGGSSGGGTAGTLVLDRDDIEKPMLGRYEVEKELGKGAMGVVYLGRDPKISRVVAIKTMALSQEFEEDELDEVKERFFREAETAGRLNHPYIVTIHDAGEEHDLAYIAMEFLKGQDLEPYTKPNNLMGLRKVLEIIMQCAQALDYAHKQNVVHRDIKPANVMYDAETDQMKITDFGIARITDASKTKTGMVLGTPSFMSPEQLSGKKIDGRSDLFSLGVMLFQLATGKLPFQGDSMASLMYKITNDAHPSVLEFREDLPPYLEIIIARALEKNADDRYLNGNNMAKDIAKCIKQLDS